MSIRLIDVVLLVWLLVVTGVVIQHARLTGEVVKHVAALDARVSALEMALQAAAAKPDTVAAVVHYAEWRAARDAAEPGSPKHEAYTNRLRSVGAI